MNTKNMNINDFEQPKVKEIESSVEHTSFDVINITNITDQIYKPYQYHNPIIIERVIDMIEEYFRIMENKNNEEPCCICLESKSFEEKTYFKCKHFICVTCFAHSNLKMSINPCPLCRSPLERYILSDKYAVIALGEQTKHKIFDNGGYNSVSIVYFPDHPEFGINKLFENITYHDENEHRILFSEHVEELMYNGYIIIMQDFNKMKKWLDCVMLKNLIYDIRIQHE